MMAAAMPVANAFADESSAFVTKSVGDGLVVITDYTDTTAEEIVIPSKIGDDTVVGVEAFAFALCDDLATVVVPETLQADYIDTNAFVTPDMIAQYAIPSEVKTVKDLVKYYADLAGVTFTDELFNRVLNKIGDVNIAGTTLQGAAAVIARNVDSLGLSETNLKRFTFLTESLLKYKDTAGNPFITLEGPADTDIQAYAIKKNIEYVVTSGYATGDVNRSGETDVFDAIAVAQYSVGKISLDDEQLEIADVNGDGKVDVFDAIAIVNLIK
jgi:hypothetical protein